MASRVVMPKLTDTMEEGVVVKWKKHEGDPVGAGDVLAEIETDKAVMDLEAFSSGTLRRVLVGEGETVPSGKLIAVIAEPDEDITDSLAETIGQASTPAPPPAVTMPEPGQPSVRPVSAAPPPAPRVHQGEILEFKASPRAKTMARERGVNLATLRGSGPGGRITERDVTQAARQSAPQAPATTDRPLSQMRKAIARTTTQSKAPVPHFYVTIDISMDEAERFRSQFNHTRSEHLSVNAMILKAAALALTRHPEINVSYAGDILRQHGTIDIGVAVGLEDGLISPVLRDCGRKTLVDISREAKALAERAKRRQLAPEEYTGATFSVSNLGMYDVESFVAILVPPEAAALAVGSVREVPTVNKSRIRIGRRMTVTLSCDHRALDGVQAARFVQEVRRVLEHPLELVLAEVF